jgi:hypothetical protein
MALSEPRSGPGLSRATPADTSLSIPCPTCEKPMGFLAILPSHDVAEPPTPVYQCPAHGGWRLDLDGVFRQSSLDADVSRD